MLLKLYSDDSLRTVNVNKTFFDDVKVRTGKVLRTITPSDKAEDMGKDLFGRKFKGHILENDGKVVSNTLENRDSNPPNDSKFFNNSKESKRPSGTSTVLRFNKNVQGS